MIITGGNEKWKVYDTNLKILFTDQICHHPSFSDIVSTHHQDAPSFHVRTRSQYSQAEASRKVLLLP